MSQELQKNFIVSEEMFLNTFINKKLGMRSLERFSFWFPVKSSPELAQTVANLLADGHIAKSFFQFISKNQKDVVSFKNKIKNLFKVEGKIRRSPSNPSVWECIVFCGPLCRVLELCGAVRGNKVFTDFLIPSWILKGNKIVQAKFLRGLFDGEGSVTFHRNRIRVRLVFHKSKNKIENLRKFLEQVRSLLFSFDIKSTNLILDKRSKRKDGRKTIGFEFEIDGTRNNLTSINSFSKFINFDSADKAQKLKLSLQKLNNQ